MAFLLRLLNYRRNAASAVASLSFLLLILIFSVHLVATRRRDDPVSAGAAVTSTISSSSGASSPATTRCDAEELRSLPDNAARCRYLSSPGRSPCAPRGYVDYLAVFYCGFGSSPPWLVLAAAVALLWLLVLFYLLGDTASTYFCASLEGLSSALRLPPSIAGVTLLSLGNGAPDVLSSVVAFAAGDADAGDVGLSSVLGGALFVSTVVAGVVAIVAAGRSGGDDVSIEHRGFVRDVCFLLVALCYLVAVLVLAGGEVTVWTAASFLSLYAAYVLLVSFSHCCSAAAGDEDDDGLLPEHHTKSSKPAAADLAAPLLLAAGNNGDAAPPVPIATKTTSPSTSPPKKTFSRRAMDVLESPLYLPRRLTIPDIAAHRWSKPYAIASAFLAPLLLAFISSSSTTNPIFLLSGVFSGFVLAALASLSTSPSSPPTTRLSKLPWLAGGFAMSILWSYLLARELVALLVSIGLAGGVRASVLGATVLAWGNSLGDLVADVALAAGGGSGGAQTAVAGCYAGPAFNVVVGLGLSMMVAAAASYPRVYVVAVDSPAFEAVGFLVAALVWAVVVLPARGMRLDRVFGVGLLVVYGGFLAVRLGSLAGAFG
ncbi:hypothetical protein HU200_008844 [Digitaria exilis]|uniref:Sodium/calcium exchanger membrane region domain-containing protein n=1 Tax=Digitaria exilis TaxID=1010633 RepID=A0A835FM33_9POAL|nr:hypothetical protein HU200_008844 [Digitaria exilis]